MAANIDLTPEAEILQAALQDLFNQLNDAYWEASTIESKDLIAGCAQAVSDVLTEFNQVDFSSRTPAFTQLAADITKINKKLKQLKDNIDNIIHRISTVT